MSQDTAFESFRKLRLISFGAVLDQTKGVGRGFDTLRLALSTAILCWHSVVISYGRAVELPLWSAPLPGALVCALLPMFFALSGFLVMGSAIRTLSLKAFLSARVLRILPALATEVMISAILLGSVVTVLPLSEYFTNVEFFKYFRSLIGVIQFTLPGVFLDNPLPGMVNSSLWTIVPEILCYMYISLVIAVGMMGRPRALSILIVLVVVVVAVTEFLGFGLREIGSPLERHTLLLSFAVGNLLFLGRYFIPFSRVLFVACLVVGMVLIVQPRFATISIPFFAYVTVYLGLVPLPRVPLLDRGDYSYGIYLYAMPVQQTIAFALPDMREWYWNIAFALPITIALAMFSWTFIEKPALRLRKHINNEALNRTNKQFVRSSPATIMAILGYSLWLISMQYPIPVITDYRRWIFAGTVLCVLIAVWGARQAGGRVMLKPAPEQVS